MVPCLYVEQRKLKFVSDVLDLADFRLILRGWVDLVIKVMDLDLIQILLESPIPVLVQLSDVFVSTLAVACRSRPVDEIEHGMATFDFRIVFLSVQNTGP